MKVKDCPQCGRMHCICVSRQTNPLTAIVEAQHHINSKLLDMHLMANKLDDVGLDGLGSQIRSLANQIAEGVEAIDEAVNRKLNEDVYQASASVGLTLKTLIGKREED